MSTFVLKKKREPWKFALEENTEKEYSLPALKSLSFEDAKLMTDIDEESDLVKKGNMIRGFIDSKCPDLKEAGLSDMEYLEILNEYALSEGKEALGESKASQDSSKNTARR